MPTLLALASASAEPTLAATLGKAALPILMYAAIAPVLWLFFRQTWRELDLEAHEHRGKTIAAGGYDLRPAGLFVITALVLTLQEYYGGRHFYDVHLRPWLNGIEEMHGGDRTGFWRHVSLTRYGELYGYAWWALTRCVGYVVVPLALWKLFFRRDSLLDMGLRLRGALKHAWIYALCLAVVLPAVYMVSLGKDFGGYYPFYKSSSRSWFDFGVWEAMYIAQFFALEVFFRGFWLNALRTTLGSGAIFAMCVPYCMIHYGKPYLEAAGAVIAGIALGSLSMRTRSIYAGFLVHVTVALAMDLLALHHRGALPRVLWPVFG